MSELIETKTAKKIYLTELWRVKNEEIRLSRHNTDVMMKILRLVEAAEVSGEKCKIIFSINESKIDSKIIQKDI